MANFSSLREFESFPNGTSPDVRLLLSAVEHVSVVNEEYASHAFMVRLHRANYLPIALIRSEPHQN